MVNKKQKGDKAEREVAEFYRSHGYIVQLAHRTMKRVFNPKTKQIFYVSGSNDFFGLFDGIAIHHKYRLAFYQVKSQPSHYYQARKEILAWSEKYFSSAEIEYIVWLRVSRTGWVKYSTQDSNSPYYYNLKFVKVDKFNLT